MRKFLIPSLFCTLLNLAGIASAQSLSASFYDIGTPTLTDYYVDPVAGLDSNSGLTAFQPRRTLNSIWNNIPKNTELTKGIRINLLPGSYGEKELPNYWEDRKGTAASPIIVRAYKGYGGVFFTRDINMAGVSYFYLLGIDIKNRTSQGYGDSFHAERCDHILLRSNSFNGAPNGLKSGADVAHETIKFNQSRNIYIENNNIQGADDNAIDFVAVNTGHVRANRIHDTQGWCMYAKGGSSYLLLEGNLVSDCGEGGITAGQGTGFEFMEAPYLRFEANYIKIVNNIIHDVTGAALGINGGYNVLVAHNTAYKVGSRSHLLEVVFGERSCDGDISACQSRRNAGGWGPTSLGSDSTQPIGNRNVSIINNVVYNPAGVSSGSQHLAIYGPRSPSAEGIPAPQLADSGLVIKGNIFWNGNSSMPVGVEEGDQGCQPANSTCNLSQLLSDNRFNTTEPDFISASETDFRPVANGRLEAVSSAEIEDFAVLEPVAGAIPEGDRANHHSREFSGASVTSRPPGAIVSVYSSTGFPSPGGNSGIDPIVPGPGKSGAAPTLNITKASAKKASPKIAITIEVAAADSDGITSVKAVLSDGKKSIGSLTLKSKKTKYSATKSVKSSAKKVTIKVTATDASGQSTVKSKVVKVT